MANYEQHLAVECVEWREWLNDLIAMYVAPGEDAEHIVLGAMACSNHGGWGTNGLENINEAQV